MPQDGLMVTINFSSSRNCLTDNGIGEWILLADSNPQPTSLIRNQTTESKELHQMEMRPDGNQLLVKITHKNGLPAAVAQNLKWKVMKAKLDGFRGGNWFSTVNPKNP